MYNCPKKDTPLIFLQFLDKNKYLAPHMKDPMYACLEPKTQGYGMTFKPCNLGSK